MAIVFYSKITFRPGSVFCFGTISSIADEEGTLHRIADPPKKKSTPTRSENIGVRKEKARPPALRKKIALGKPGAESPLTRKTPVGGLRPQRRTERSLSLRRFHSTPTSSSSGEEWNRPLSPTMNQPRRGRNLFSGNLTDEGTDAEISGDITRPESGTRHSLCCEIRSRR